MQRTTLGRPVVVVFEAGDWGPETVFRIVRSDEPDAPEFIDSLKSHYELDRPPRGHERRSAVLHMCLSMWRTAEQAAAVARRWPVIGDFGRSWRFRGSLST